MTRRPQFMSSGRAVWVYISIEKEKEEYRSRFWGRNAWMVLNEPSHFTSVWGTFYRMQRGTCIGDTSDGALMCLTAGSVALRYTDENDRTRQNIFRSRVLTLSKRGTIQSSDP
ncbi:hypothetical protein PROFUN_05873 [Planoprotostelium fungivorum]|uniref:Uncharacterized protein n=1 Tax=Planoprotostelium fungivorum TaxID=1890364 RepID=A0A2P6NKS5_9EUKA|nr:hypothetical protein PROFUN_05873 [Planoprotostelium fungivorum]